MYKLHLPLLMETDKKDAAIIDKIVPLLQEVLGYTNIEIDKMIDMNFCCDVAKNITLNEAKEIIQPFYDNDVHILYLMDNNTGKLIGYSEVFKIEKGMSKSHYYDEPVVRRDQLVDPFAPKTIPQRSSAVTTPVNNRPVVECPYCHSTNTEKISTVSKGVAAALFGVFSLSRNSKQFHCNDCKSDF